MSVSAAVEIIDRYFTCEFTTLSRDGSPVTWPVSPRLLADGRFLLTTSIGMPQKAFNIRRNPKVSLLFSEPTGSGVSTPGAVLVQGDATAEDRIVTDVSADEDLILEHLAWQALGVALPPSPHDLRDSTPCAVLADPRLLAPARGTRRQRGASCGLRRPSGSTNSTKPF
jgi:hypothetical protein